MPFLIKILALLKIKLVSEMYQPSISIGRQGGRVGIGVRPVLNVSSRTFAYTCLPWSLFAIFTILPVFKCFDSSINFRFAIGFDNMSSFNKVQSSRLVEIIRECQHVLFGSTSNNIESNIIQKTQNGEILQINLTRKILPVRKQKSK